MVFADKMHHIIQQLEGGNYVLIPTDTVWSLAISMQCSGALDELLVFKKNKSEHPTTILVNSLEMLKKFCPKLHPRIETLLLYHERPLTILYPTHHSAIPPHLHISRMTAFRMTLDPFCQKVIDLMQSPIVVSAAYNQEGSYANHRDEIHAELIRHAGYICQHRAEDKRFTHEVVVSYNADGDLIFHRD